MTIRGQILCVAVVTFGLALASGSTGVADVITTGSTYTDSSSNFYAGYTANGTLGVTAGSPISDANGYLGYNSGCTGAATVTGGGSTWTNGPALYVGYSGCGILNIQTGGVVNTASKPLGSSQSANIGYSPSSTDQGPGPQVDGPPTHGYIGFQSGSTGTVTVTGAGSKWTLGYSLGSLLNVGYSGTGKLTVTDSGEVAAINFNVNNISAIRLEVSGNNMLRVGSSGSNGGLTNNGEIDFYADSMLTTGAYSPISAYPGVDVSSTGVNPNGASA